MMGWLDQYTESANAQELINYYRIYSKICPLFKDVQVNDIQKNNEKDIQKNNEKGNEKDKKEECEKMYYNLMYNKVFKKK